MHLSCGQCKGIRPFSGDPPTCDVCGWKLGDPYPLDEWQEKGQERIQAVQRTAQQKKVNDFVGLVIALVAIFFLAFLLLPWLWRSEKQKVADEYHVREDRVYGETEKPHGCDFDDAPLGKKHCHFVRHVEKSQTWNSQTRTYDDAVYIQWERVEE